MPLRQARRGASARLRPAKGERGFALLLVIWVLAILAVLAVGFAAGTRSESRLARNLLEAARARALAEAGVARAGAGLFENDPQRQWRADSAEHAMSFEAGLVRVRIDDENGKVDINLAPPELLSNLCLELGIDPDVCTGLIDGVMHRRRVATPASTPRPQRPQPQPSFQPGRAIGLGASPVAELQVAAFAAVEELRQLPGIDQVTLDRLRPFITVYGQRAQVDASVAPPEVLLAIPGVDRREVELLLQTRALPPLTPGTGAAPALTGVNDYVAQGQLHFATIHATATTESGATFNRRAVVGLTGSPVQPLQILEWRQDVEGEEGDAGAPAAEENEPQR